MKSANTRKRIALLVLLVVVLGVFSTASMAQQPDGGQLDSVVCGDDISCNRNNAAVKVSNNGAGAAFYGKATAPGTGVKGQGKIGVWGFSYNGVGVNGVSSTNGYGGQFDAASDYDLVLGTEYDDDGIIWSDPEDTNGDLMLRSHDEIWLYLDHDDNDGAEFRVYDSGAIQFRVDDDVNSSWYARWEAGANDLNIRTRDDMYLHLNDEQDGAGPGVLQVLAGDDSVILDVRQKGAYISGDLDVAGSTGSVVATSQGARRLSAVESPSAWVEDFGAGQLADGVAVVNLDGLFLETVNTSVDYHVFLTPVGSEAVLLFVTAKMPGSFEVQGVTLDGSAASIGFDYRIVAKQAGYEGVRLDAVQQMGTDGEDFPTAPAKARPVEEDID